MDTTTLVIQTALTSIPGILGLLVAAGSLVGYLMKQQAGETIRMSLLVGVLMGVGLVAFSIISTKTTLDASMPNRISLEGNGAVTAAWASPAAEARRPRQSPLA